MERAGDQGFELLSDKKIALFAIFCIVEAMQPIKQLAQSLRTLADKEHCVFALSDLAAAVPECRQLPVLLSRATKAGLLRRVCRGIYSGSDWYNTAGMVDGRICIYVARLFVCRVGICRGKSCGGFRGREIQSADGVNSPLAAVCFSKRLPGLFSDLSSVKSGL